MIYYDSRKISLLSKQQRPLLSLSPSLCMYGTRIWVDCVGSKHTHTHTTWAAQCSPHNLGGSAIIGRGKVERVGNFNVENKMMRNAMQTVRYAGGPGETCMMRGSGRATRSIGDGALLGKHRLSIVRTPVVLRNGRFFVHVTRMHRSFLSSGNKLSLAFLPSTPQRSKYGSL